MEHKGLRYNEGKVQLELLPVNAPKGVGEVLTKGAKNTKLIVFPSYISYICNKKYK